MAFENQFHYYTGYVSRNYRMLFERDKGFAKYHLGFLTTWKDLSLPRQNTTNHPEHISCEKNRVLRSYSHLPYPTRCVLRAFFSSLSLSQ